TDGGILRHAADGPKEGDVVPVGKVLGYLTAVGEILAPTPSVAPAPVPESPPSERSAQAAPGPAPPGARSRRPVTPRARRAAARLGIDWSQVKGTGRNGRIREQDVVGYSVGPRDERRGVGLDPGRVRRAIAQRMVHSSRTTAPVTLTTTADATN